MGGDEQHDHRGQEDDVRRVPARERQGADGRPAAQHAGDDLAGKRRQFRDVDRDDGRPVGALIPGEEIAGQREAEDERKQGETGEPRDFTRRLVRAERDHPQHVRRERDDDEAGTVVMQAAHEPAGAKTIDEPHAVVRVIRRRRVVERQERAGQQLDREEPEQHAAEREEPPGARRQRFVEHHTRRVAIPGAGMHPVDEPLHSRTSTDVSAGSMRASIVASGRGGGPASTAPSAA